MATPSIYYLTVDGLDGGSADRGHEGEFAVGNFSFDIDRLVGWASGKVTAGKPDLAPLVIDFDPPGFIPGANLNGFIKNITQGTSFPHVRLEGVTSSANGAQTVYDLRLDGVFATKVTDTNEVDHLELVYKAVSLTTTDQNSDGTLGTPQTIGWNVAAGTPITTPLVAAVAGTSGGGAPPLSLFLTVDGLPGGSLARGYEGAFEIDNFSFDIDALTSWTSGRASVGRPDLAPLIIGLPSVNSFIPNMTQGQSFPHVRLEGVIISDTSLQTVYDLRLDDVFVNKVTDTNGGDHLELVYKAVSLTTRERNLDGTFGAPQTIGWNVFTATPITTPLVAAVAVTLGGNTFDGVSTDYYLTVDGLDGGSVDRGHEGEFAVRNFSFDIDRLASWTSGFARAGIPDFSAPLIIDLQPGANLNGFIQNITQGGVFPHVRLEGVGNSAQRGTLYDLRLDRVSVTKVTDTNGDDHLELFYQAVTLTTTVQKNDGTLGVQKFVFGWDVATGTRLTTPLVAAVAGTTQVVAPGVVTSGASVASHETLEVESGGTANVTQIGGGILQVDSGGVATGTVISGEGIEDVFGGTEVQATVESGGTLDVSWGGTAIGATVLSGGSEQVEREGVASGTTISSGGGDTLGSGGVSISATVMSGGTQTVLSGGTAIGTSLSGGALYVESGGVESGAAISSGGIEHVFGGALASGATVNRGGEQYVFSGGTTSASMLSDLEVLYGSAIGTQVSSDGGLYVESGGTESGAAVLSGGIEYVFGGAQASGATVNHGGEQYVFSGGTTSASKLSDLEVLYGSAIGTQVSSGGGLYVESSGAESGAAVLSGGIEYVFGGALASGTTVNHGGEQYVFSGGTTSASMLGGVEMLYGSATGTQVQNGGVLYVQAGGMESGAVVASGGLERIQSGGSASGTLVTSGGLEVVSAGGLAAGTTISGGTFEVRSGGSTGAGPVTFATSGGGILQLDDSIHYGGSVAGFGKPDLLDLPDILFISGTTSAIWTPSGTSSGTLAVTDGINTANITLLGQYMTANFHVSNDGHGTTFVSNPPVVAQTDQQAVGFVNPHQA